MSDVPKAKADRFDKFMKVRHTAQHLTQQRGSRQQQY